MDWKALKGMENLDESGESADSNSRDVALTNDSLVRQAKVVIERVTILGGIVNHRAAHRSSLKKQNHLQNRRRGTARRTLSHLAVERKCVPDDRAVQNGGVDEINLTPGRAGHNIGTNLYFTKANASEIAKVSTADQASYEGSGVLDSGKSCR